MINSADLSGKVAFDANGLNNLKQDVYKRQGVHLAHLYCLYRHSLSEL